MSCAGAPHVQRSRCGGIGGHNRGEAAHDWQAFLVRWRADTLLVEAVGSSVCCLRCLTSTSWREKPLLQTCGDVRKFVSASALDLCFHQTLCSCESARTSHLYGLSASCVRMCRVRCSARAYDLDWTGLEEERVESQSQTMIALKVDAAIMIERRGERERLQTPTQPGCGQRSASLALVV